jgi:hypothetical protein
MPKTITAGQIFARDMRKNLGIGTRTRRFNTKKFGGHDMHRTILEAIANATFESGYYSEPREAIFRTAFATYSSYEKHIHNYRASAEVVSHINALSPWQFCNLIAEMIDAGVSNVGEGERFFRQMRDELHAKTSAEEIAPTAVEQPMQDVSERVGPARTTSAAAPTIQWADQTNRQLRPYASANRWTLTCGTKEYLVERTIHAYHLWDGDEWIGMYATTAEVEAAATPSADVAPEQATDADVITAFEAKADEAAAVNGWTIGHAESVMLRFLRDSNPDEAATIAAALQRRTKLCA